MPPPAHPTQAAIGPAQQITQLDSRPSDPSATSGPFDCFQPYEPADACPFAELLPSPLVSGIIPALAAIAEQQTSRRHQGEERRELGESGGPGPRSRIPTPIPKMGVVADSPCVDSSPLVEVATLSPLSSLGRGSGHPPGSQRRLDGCAKRTANPCRQGPARFHFHHRVVHPRLSLAPSGKSFLSQSRPVCRP